MTFLLGILARFWPQILGAAVLVGAWVYFDEFWCNAPCERARAEGKECSAMVAAARQRATDLALLAAKRLDEIDAAAKRQKDIDDATFHALAARADSLPAGATVRLSAASLRLWGDAARAANDTGPAGLGTPPADTVPAAAETTKEDGGGAGDEWYSERDIEAFNVAAAASYLDAVHQWAACVQTYDAVRATYGGGE